MPDTINFLGQLEWWQLLLVVGLCSLVLVVLRYIILPYADFGDKQ